MVGKKQKKKNAITKEKIRNKNSQDDLNDDKRNDNILKLKLSLYVSVMMDV